MIEDTQQTFGSKLKELRLAAGIGLRELAKMIGKSPSYLSEIESGHVPPPSAEMIIDIAHALGGYKNELLAAASKMDPQLTDYVAHQPEAADFLRKAQEYGLDGRLAETGTVGRNSFRQEGGEMSVKVPWLPKDAINQMATEVLLGYEDYIGQTLSPPIPVEDIIERYLELDLEYVDFYEKYGLDNVFGALYVKKRTVAISEITLPR